MTNAAPRTWASRLVAGARRYLLQHEIRLRWGSRPRVIVRDEGGSWSTVLNERWLPSSTERTLVLGALPETSDGRGAQCSSGVCIASGDPITNSLDLRWR